MFVLTNIILPIVIAGLTSSGVWAFISQQLARNSASRDMLLAMAHDRVVSTASMYIRRGWISPDEYEDYVKYVYRPYKNLGGNGLAERLTSEVEKLPVSFEDKMMRSAEELDKYLNDRKESDE